jgi:hypothetical protein
MTDHLGRLLRVTLEVKPTTTAGPYPNAAIDSPSRPP